MSKCQIVGNLKQRLILFENRKRSVRNFRTFNMNLRTKTIGRIKKFFFFLESIEQFITIHARLNVKLSAIARQLDNKKKIQSALIEIANHYSLSCMLQLFVSRPIMQPLIRAYTTVSLVKIYQPMGYNFLYIVYTVHVLVNTQHQDAELNGSIDEA